MLLSLQPKVSGLVWRDFDPTGSLDKTSWADLDAWGLSLGFCVGAIRFGLRLRARVQDKFRRCGLGEVSGEGSTVNTMGLRFRVSGLGCRDQGLR